MQTHITIHHPVQPTLTYHTHSSLTDDGDDFVTLRLGTSLTDSITLHFLPAEFAAWRAAFDTEAKWLGHAAVKADERRRRYASLTSAQVATLMRLCTNYNVDFDPLHYAPQFDLPSGYVGGWVGGNEFADLPNTHPDCRTTIYVGVDPEGNASS